MSIHWTYTLWSQHTGVDSCTRRSAASQIFYAVFFLWCFTPFFLQRSIALLCIAQGFAHCSSVGPVVTKFCRSHCSRAFASDGGRRNTVVELKIVLCFSLLCRVAWSAQSWSWGKLPAATNKKSCARFVRNGGWAFDLCSSSALATAASLSSHSLSVSSLCSCLEMSLAGTMPCRFLHCAV